MRRLYLPIWAFLSVWPLSAAASSFAVGVRAYDWESLMYAVSTALVGASFKTAFTLSSTRVAVLSALRELWRDAAMASIAGVVMYIAIGLIGALWQPLPFLVAMPMLFAAGWARGAFLTWTEGRAKDLADTTVDSLADRIRSTMNPQPQDGYRPYGRGPYRPPNSPHQPEQDFRED